MRAGFGAWCGRGGTRMRCRCGGDAPYAEFSDQGWADAEAGQLIELRASAEEEWAEQRLDAGESAALVPELVARVAADPLRERPRGQLMRALYRSGRTADALASYQDYRRRLRDELGLTPSVTLRHLEEAILRDDPSLDGRPPAPESLVNLPAALVRLIGREAELRSVPQLFDQSRLVTFVGPGGAGKTSLAIAAAGQIANQLPARCLVRTAGPASGSVPPAGRRGRGAGAFGSRRPIGYSGRFPLACHPQRAARRRQLRAPHRRVRPVSPGVARRGARGFGARNQPRATWNPRRGAAPRSAARDRRCGASVLRTGTRCAPGLQDRRGRGPCPRDCGGPRRHAARDRAGRCPRQHHDRRGDLGPPRRSLRVAHERSANGARAPPVTPCRRRLELRPARRVRT